MDPSNRQASARLRGKCESAAGTTPSLVVVTSRTIWMGFSTRLYIYIKSNNNVSSTCIEIWYDKYHRIVSLLNLQISTGNLLVLAFSHESLLPYALFVVYGLMHQATLTKIPDSQSILDRFSAVSITDRSRIPTWFCLWFLHLSVGNHILEGIYRWSSMKHWIPQKYV